MITLEKKALKKNALKRSVWKIAEKLERALEEPNFEEKMEKSYR